MSRDASYKPEGSTIVTVPLDPALHKRLRIHAASEGRSIKSAVTQMIENRLAATPTPPTLSEDLRVLVEALEPFAAACNITTAEDSESLYDSLAAEKLTWRDLRRARAALAQVKAS